MAKQPRAALVYAGPVRRGTLNKLPGLPAQLKFIKSSSVATASRAVRALRAGQAVRRYEDLKDADLILISVPANVVKRTEGELAGSGLSWNNKCVVLFDSEAESSALNELRRRGSAIASLNWSPQPERFFAEGDSAALRRIRSLIGDVPLLVLNSKSTYLKAERASREEFFPILASTVDLFRKAGLERAAAEQTAASMFAESIRAWRRAGRRLLTRGAK